jgi:hypothetical protein
LVNRLETLEGTPLSPVGDDEMVTPLVYGTHEPVPIAPSPVRVG